MNVSSSVNLRKLSWKSKLQGIVSKYGSNTVEWVANNHPSTLVYIYYHFEKISFVDEILDYLEAIFEKFERIDKPGFNRSMTKYVLTKYRGSDNTPFLSYNNFSYDELKRKMAGYRINNAEPPDDLKNAFMRKKAERSTTLDKTNHVDSKQKLQGKNHGR